MSFLVNGITTAVPLVDSRLNGKIVIAATHPIPQEIRDWMTKVIWAIAEQLSYEEIKDIGLPINCIFSNNDSYEIRIEFGEVSICTKNAFYPVRNLEEYAGNPFKLCTILAEELCHLIWEISDEIEVNYKVYDVLLRIFPELKIEQLYNQEYLK